MATRLDVAAAANVAPSTVTNVFNNSKYVSMDVKKKVLKAAEEVGYIQKGK